MCDPTSISLWERRLEALFLKLGPGRSETAWHGQIDMTADHLPRIHRLADNLCTAIGDNRRGIAPGTTFGLVLGEFLSGGREEDLPLPIIGVRPTPRRALMPRLYQTAVAASQLIKNL